MIGGSTSLPLCSVFLTCSDVDETGAFRLDRNPKYFEPLLGFLRDGSLTLDQGISARGVCLRFGHTVMITENTTEINSLLCRLCIQGNQRDEQPKRFQTR